MAGIAAIPAGLLLMLAAAERRFFTGMMSGATARNPS
jgi:hypothetical protein